MRRELVMGIFCALALQASVLAGGGEEAPPSPPPPVREAKVTILSTMLSGNPRDGGIGEWGFAALVEVDGHRLLYDTGARPGTVLQNAKELGIDLSDVTDVVLSHYHDDHVGGLLTLRRELAKKNPAALSRAHVAAGIFLSRTDPGSDKEINPMIEIRPKYEATGGTFDERSGPDQIWPGVWLTGPIPRVYPEHNVSGSARLKTADGFKPDDVPEDQSLVLDTPRGLVVVSGCAHAGIVNTLELARSRIRAAPVYAAIGGFHLFPADDATLAWTAGKLREFGLARLLGAHCTGIEAVFRLRDLTGLDRKTALVGSVGASFSLEKGIDPLLLAR